MLRPTPESDVKGACELFKIFTRSCLVLRPFSSSRASPIVQCDKVGRNCQGMPYMFVGGAPLDVGS